MTDSKSNAGQYNNSTVVTIQPNWANVKQIGVYYTKFDINWVRNRIFPAGYGMSIDLALISSASLGATDARRS